MLVVLNDEGPFSIYLVAYSHKYVMREHLIEFNVPFDRDTLYAESQNLAGYVPFIDPLNGNSISGWKIKHITDGYGLELSNYFRDLFDLKDCRPRFYIQDVGYTIGFHKDRGTLCSFNFVLQGSSDPVSFRDADICYQTCLLNTQAEHAVMGIKEQRVLYKISVFDKTYDEVSNVLQSKLSCR